MTAHQPKSFDDPTPGFDVIAVSPEAHEAAEQLTEDMDCTALLGQLKTLPRSPVHARTIAGLSECS